MKLPIDYCDLCKKKPSCELLQKLRKPGGYTIDDLSNIYRCEVKTMDSVCSGLSKDCPLSKEPQDAKNLIIAFLYLAQSSDRIESALQYTEDFELCYDLVKLASYRLVEILGDNPKNWSRRDHAMESINKLYRLWDEKRRRFWDEKQGKGGAK